MNKPKQYNTLRLELGRVGMRIGCLVSALLGRKIDCTASCEDYDYWCATASDSRFTTEELIYLIRYVDGNASMYRTALPEEDDSSSSLDMSLSRALLKKAMQMDWETEFVTPDALWVIGYWADGTELREPEAGKLYIGKTAVTVNRLLPADEFTARLFDTGGNSRALTEICEQYRTEFGNRLYWQYPLSSEEHCGTYFVLVQEGVLAVSYDEVTKQDHEIFSRDSVKLCSAEDLYWYIIEWKHKNEAMLSVLDTLEYYQEQKEQQK